MEILTLEEAVKLTPYKNKESFRKAVHRDGIPHRKQGGFLIFFKDELINYFRLLNNTFESVESGESNGGKKCHLSSEKVVRITGHDSPHQTEQEYSDLLKL